MFCHRTQEFLAEKGIEFEDRDVTKDSRALEERNSRVTSTLVINGEVLRGFQANRKRVEELLR